MKRIGWILATGFAALAAGASILFHPAPKLVWNASASVPIGLYAIHPIDGIQSGDLVLVLPPEAVARYLAQRGYLPLGVPILKHVLALPGQSVCRIERTITVDGVACWRCRSIAIARDEACPTGRAAGLSRTTRCSS